jgi:hypothetical protein
MLPGPPVSFPPKPGGKPQWDPRLGFVIIALVLAVVAVSGWLVFGRGSSGSAKPAATASELARAMGIAKFTAYTASTDPNHLLGRQHEYTSKVSWASAGIEVFSDQADASARKAYLGNFTCPLGDGYDYLDGSSLLRLGCSVTPKQAKDAEAVFRKAVAGDITAKTAARAPPR